MNKIKLIFFDMDGTLFKKAYTDSHGNTAPSPWTLIAEALGPEAHAEEEETKKKWTLGEYGSYIEWMEDTIRIHQKYGLTKDKYFEILNSIDFQAGVKETFKILREQGYKTVLMSGGFKATANKALITLKMDHAFVACEYFWAEDGTLKHWNLLPSDYEAKVEFMRLMVNEYGLTKEECAFVGDGRNDVYMAKEARLSIAFNGAKELQEVSTHSINQPEGQEDFRAILEYF